LRGSIQVRAGQASGWVFDPAAEARSLAVRLRLDGRVIAEGLADLPRPDVAQALGIAGDHGFRLPLAVPVPDAGRLRLEARADSGRPWQPVTRHGKRAGQYQSFGDAAGASDSRRKLDALRLALLPNRVGGKASPLAGLSVLDLGCNEGFFCGEALRQGARRVVGIDANAAVLSRAKARFPAAEFRQGSWWDLPEERFDVILLLSAIHYEPDQAALLAMLAKRLAPGGTLVLECGVSRRGGKAWQTVVRGDGPRRFPTHALLVEELADPFACRWVGPSVPQRGDPVPRRVYHCVPKAGTVLLVAGPGRVGKSTLAGELERRGIPLVRTDRVLGAVLRDARFDGTPLAGTVRRFSAEHPVHFGRIGDAVAAERPAELVAALLAELPPGASVASIEGEILRHAAILDPLSRALRERGLRPWVIAAQRPSPLREAGSRAAAWTRAALAAAAFAAGRLWRRARGTPQGAVRRGSEPGAGNP